MKRSGVLTKLRITVGEIDLPALQIWIVANFVSMALILILGIRLGYLLFASHADFFSWKFLGAALVANAWLIAAAALARIIMVGMAYRVVGALRSSEARARQVAGRDVLSGLPNRFLFNELTTERVHGHLMMTHSQSLVIYNLKRVLPGILIQLHGILISLGIVVLRKLYLGRLWLVTKKDI